VGEEVFYDLIKRFEHRYPHHKLLTQYLLSPGSLDLAADAEDVYWLDALDYFYKSASICGD
jgi:hypothetical protein